MKGHCCKCGGEQELREGPQRVIRHALPWLASPIEIEVPRICTVCESEVGWDTRLLPTDTRDLRVEPAQAPAATEYRNGHIWTRYDSGETLIAALNYPGVVVPGNLPLLLPAQEGSLSHAKVVDRHGKPDLMAAFAGEYLKQHRVIMPKGRLPCTPGEMMPALHLLVVAAELALKAYLIRSRTPTRGHDFRDLYALFRDEHRQEIENRFAGTTLNANLKARGHETVTIESVLGAYGEWNGSTVYNETRYFAEPTTELRKGSKGANLIKATPYPIFLPFAVWTLIETYPYFSGAERLRRQGADVQRGARDQEKGNHGDWGLLPSSVGLVVLRVAQRVAWDDAGAERDDFRRFKDAHPAGYETSWMYGGNTLLFYGAHPDLAQDGETVIDGLECRIWSTGRLGMHARDLYHLADVVEAPDAADRFQWRAVDPEPAAVQSGASVTCPLLAD